MSDDARERLLQQEIFENQRKILALAQQQGPILAAIIAAIRKPPPEHTP